MNLGKIDPRHLDRLLDQLPEASDRLLVGPSIGEDTAIYDLQDMEEDRLVISSDPISGAEKDIGRYAVHVNANDVATAGARPSLFTCNILMSQGSTERDLERVYSQISGECGNLGITIIGGHTEVSPIPRAIVSGTMMGFAQRKRIARRPVRKGDILLLTKGAGIEGTSIIASEREKELRDSLGREVVEKAKSYSSKISIVEEAMIAAGKTVKRMHDPTEGGVVGGILELCTATGSTARVHRNKIPVSEETRMICEHFDIDPLKLIGSGSLLCILAPEEGEDLRREISEAGIPAAVIGKIESDEEAGAILVQDSSATEISDFPPDELWNVVSDH